MFKKAISTLLVVTMVGAMGTTVFASAPVSLVANNGDNEIRITNPIVRPIQILAGNLDPAAYGGVYQNNNGKIYISVFDEASVLRSMAKSNITKDQVVFFKAKYTMKQLLDGRQRLSDQMQSLGIMSLDINEKDNCLEVAIRGDSNETIAEVKKLAGIDDVKIVTNASQNIPSNGGDTAKEEKISIPFKNGTIIEAYSLDYANRSYHKITDFALLTDMSLRLEDYTPAVSKDKNQVGFLIFTEKGKYEYYLDNDEKKAVAADKPLIELSKKCNEKFPASAQWLAYMSSSNIKRVRFSGAYGKGYSLKKPAPTALYDLTFDTNDKKYFEKIAAFLKAIEVSDSKIIEPTNPQTDDGLRYYISIDFASGVNYSIFGSKDGLTIASSYNDEVISYKCAESEINALRDFMSDLGIGEREKWN